MSIGDTLLQHPILGGVVDKGMFKQPIRSRDSSMHVKDAGLCRARPGENQAYRRQTGEIQGST